MPSDGNGSGEIRISDRVSVSVVGGFPDHESKDKFASAFKAKMAEKLGVDASEGGG